MSLREQRVDCGVLRDLVLKFGAEDVELDKQTVLAGRVAVVNVGLCRETSEVEVLDVQGQSLRVGGIKGNVLQVGILE